MHRPLTSILSAGGRPTHRLPFKASSDDKLVSLDQGLPQGERLTVVDGSTIG